MNIKLGGGFKYVFFRPYLGKISNLTNILAQGIFCWIENAPEWFEISKRLGQRRKPRCLSCPAAAWRGDGARSCCQLRPIPFKRAHGLPAWRGSCRTSVSVRKAASVAWNTATQNISPPPIWSKSQSRQQFDPSTGPARCKHIGNESWKRRLENHRKCKFSSHHHVCSGEWEETWGGDCTNSKLFVALFFPWKGHWT